MDQEGCYRGVRATELVGDGDLLADLADLDAAVGLFNAAGVCFFEDVLPSEVVGRMRAATEGIMGRIDAQLVVRNVALDAPFRFSEVCRRRFGRYDVRNFGMDGAPFVDTLADANAPWLPFVRQLLGEHAVELWHGVVDNRPGSADQQWHRDGEHLWGHTHLPPHCITLFIPLCDCTEAMGPTHFYPGSHALWRESKYVGAAENTCHLPTCAPLLRGGSMVAFDYRVIHRGSANTHTSSRPYLYLVYAKSWFRDVQNFPDVKLFEEACDEA